jgi:hypothetical protein
VLRCTQTRPRHSTASAWRAAQTTWRTRPGRTIKTGPSEYRRPISWQRQRPSCDVFFGITDPSTDPSGTELLRRWFTSESVLLAEQGGYSNPARSITDPGFHLAWARRTRFVAIVRDLMDKQREQFDRQLDTGAQAWHAFCAETMSRLAAWGGALVIAPGIPAEPAAWDATCQQLAADGGPERVWKHLDHVGRTVASNLLLRARSAQSPRPS